MKNTGIKKFTGGILFLALTLTLTLVFSAYAAVPQTINYQGYLTNAAGDPVNGTVSIVLSIYNVNSGGAALWSETQSVAVNNGLYSVILGSVTPINLSFDAQYYLGVKVGTDAEMTPRQVLTSVGYSYKANSADNADTVDGSHASAFATSSHSHDADYVNEGEVNSVNTSMIQNGAVTDGKITGPISGAKLGTHAHSGADITTGTVAEARIDSLVARDSEIMPTVLASDGAGSGLDADLLDGKHASELASLTHNHDAAYVNVTGDAMIGGLSISTTTGTPLAAATTGNNNAGYFQINNPSSNNNALHAETNGIHSDAGVFFIKNPSNNYTALHAETNGIGGAGIFKVTNPSSINAAIHAETSGTNVAVSGLQYGTGSGAAFKIDNPSNNYTALHAETNGVGYSGLFLGGAGVNISGNLNVTGNFTKGSGTFVQPHPSDPKKEIIYAFFEGPEHAIFLRGTTKLINGKATISTPEHFRVVATEEGITVQFTPRSLESKGLAAYAVTRERIEVGELLSGTGTYEFDYFITGKRAGFEKHEPIQENKHFTADNVTKEEFEQRYAKTDDMTILAMRNLLISNGILTADGKLNMTMVKKLGWTVAEEKSSNASELKAELLQK